MKLFVIKIITKIKSSNLRYLIGGVSTFLLLLLLAYPLVVGIVAKQKVAELIEVMKESSKGKGELTYEISRHYLSSDVSIIVKNINNNPGTQVDVKAKLVHWSLNMVSEISFNETFKNAFLKQAKNLPQIHLESCLSIFGSIKNKVNISAFDMETGEGDSLNSWKFSPINSHFALNRKHKFENMVVEFAGLSIEVKKGDNILLDNFKISWDIDDGIRTYNSDALIQLKLLKIGALSVGPAEFTASVKGLDSNALGDLKNVSYALKADPGGASAGKDPARLQQELMGKLSDIVTRLVQHSPRLELKFKNFKTSLGDVVGDAYLALPKANLALGILSIISGLQSEIKLKVPQGIVEALIEQYTFWKDMKEKLGDQASAAKLPKFTDAQMEQFKNQSKMKVGGQINDLVNKKFLVKESSDLSLHFQLQNGSMTLNGQPFSFQQK